MERQSRLRAVAALTLGLFLLPFGGLAQSDGNNDKEDVKKEEEAKKKASPSNVHPVELEDEPPKKEIRKVKERPQLKLRRSGKVREAEQEKENKGGDRANESGAVEPRPPKERKKDREQEDE
jgi:hypothetical protein